MTAFHVSVVRLFARASSIKGAILLSIMRLFFSKIRDELFMSQHKATKGGVYQTASPFMIDPPWKTFDTHRNPQMITSSASSANL